MTSNQNKAGIKPSLQSYHDVVQPDMRFEWDSDKEALNCGIVAVLKETHQSGEELFVYIGLCKKLNVLVVVVAFLDKNVTRIISAR